PPSPTCGGGAACSGRDVEPSAPVHGDARQLLRLDARPGKNSCILPLVPSRRIPRLALSPCRIAEVIDSICSREACGGIGGTSGSVRKSSTKGRSAPSARCQELLTSPAFSTRTP